MKKNRSMSELPVELLREIFLKSPTKSLLSCKCVCKYFLDIIRNPNFARTHLICMHSHDSISIMLHLDNSFHPYRQSRHQLLSIDNATYDTISSPLINNPPIPNVGVYDQINVVGSSNGLICISVLYNHDGRKNELLFLLWNPAIGQSRFLPKSKYSTIMSQRAGVEFGYVPETNEYVVVKLEGEERVLVEVYKSSSDSWRVTECTGVLDLVCNLIKNESSVFLNGCFHWRAIGYNESNYIIGYDLFSEKVGLIKPVDLLINCKLTAVEDSLAMLNYSYGVPQMFELWTMTDYNDPDSWTRRFRIVGDGHKLLRPVGCLRNGLMIAYETDSSDVYLHDLSSGQKTKISEVPCGLGVSGFSYFSETLLPVCLLGMQS